MSNNSDQRAPVSFDQVTQVLQFPEGLNWVNVPAAATGAVTSVNSITGAVNIAAGSNITVTPSGQNITIASTGSTQVIPQVFMATNNTTTSQTANTYIAAGPSQAITLQKSTNRVKASVSGVVVCTGTAIAITIYRDGTNIGSAAFPPIQVLESSGVTPVYLTLIDSPGDVSAHTYQAYITNILASGTVYYGEYEGGSGPLNIIIVEEILS